MTDPIGKRLVAKRSVATPNSALPMLPIVRRPTRSSAERRRYQRFALRCACWLEGRDATIYATTADLGLGGLFLRSAVPIAPGLSVDIEVQSRDTQLCVLAGGIVTRAVRAMRGQRYGIGIEFTDLEGGQTALMQLLGRLHGLDAPR